MKIIDPGTQQIPNGLILHHITELETKYTQDKRLATIPPNLKAALRDVKTCLKRPPTTFPGDVIIHRTIPKKHIVRLTQTLVKKHGLLPSEALIIVNHRPVTREELSGLLEEAETRFENDEGKFQRILDTISKELGNVRAADAPVANGDGG